MGHKTEQWHGHRRRHCVRRAQMEQNRSVPNAFVSLCVRAVYHLISTFDDEFC